MAIRFQRLQTDILYDCQHDSDLECAESNSAESDFEDSDLASDQESFVSDQEYAESKASDIQHQQSSKSWTPPRSDSDTYHGHTTYISQSIAFCIHLMLEAFNFIHNISHSLQNITAKCSWREEFFASLWRCCKFKLTRMQVKGLRVAQKRCHQAQPQPPCSHSHPAAAPPQPGSPPQDLVKQAFRGMVAERRELSRKWRLQREAESAKRAAHPNDPPRARPAEPRAHGPILRAS